MCLRPYADQNTHFWGDVEGSYRLLSHPAGVGARRCLRKYYAGPIVSRRIRTGDKLQDVQIALQMLFNVKRKIYVQWYNALWDTDLTIDSYQYIAKSDNMIINLPVTCLRARCHCDKHGVREQNLENVLLVWDCPKDLQVNGVFLIDQLNRRPSKLFCEQSRHRTSTHGLNTSFRQGFTRPCREDYGIVQRVIERTRRSRSLNAVTIATTTDQSDDPVAALAISMGVPFTRGSVHDVLDRYYQAARAQHADIIVRITADCRDRSRVDRSGGQHTARWRL